jgi:hypothetical protein
MSRAAATPAGLQCTVPNRPETAPFAIKIRERREAIIQAARRIEENDGLVVVVFRGCTTSITQAAEGNYVRYRI